VLILQYFALLYNQLFKLFYLFLQTQTVPTQSKLIYMMTHLHEASKLDPLPPINAPLVCHRLLSQLSLIGNHPYHPLYFIISISLLFLYYFSIISLLFLYYFSIISLLFLYYFSTISLLFLYYFSTISLLFLYYFSNISLIFL
jgi:hypothetical protein